MATMRGRGRGGGGGGPRGEAEGGTPRRGSWRGGPPGSNGSAQNSRRVSPGIVNPAPSPRSSISDHMNDVRKPQDDKPRPGKGFQTDTDISSSANAPPRELQPWVGDSATDGPSRSNGTTNGGGRDTETFGAATAIIPWDQFETNARLFGTRTSYQEEIYTTKLNRSGADYKKREKEAEKLASEIVGQTAVNSHLADERNQIVEEWSKDEEEKFSGVARNPNAYVPPGARRVPGIGSTPSRGPAAAEVLPKTNGAPSTPAPVSATLAPPPALATSTTPQRAQSSGGPAPPADSASVELKPAPSPQPPAVVAPTAVDAKDGQLGTVLDQFRQFVGTEREKVEAKKQSMAKTERDKQLADLKQFHTSFKVLLPMPKDMLPILAKDEEKQKAIEQKAATALDSNKARKAEAANAPVVDAPKIEVPKAVGGGKKMFMKIPEIPPFNATKRKPEPLPVPATASQNIPLAVSPSPSAASQASGSQAAAAKLNPNANTFVFKPNPAAAAFKPGQSSSGSPAAAPAQVIPPATAGPSAHPKNLFFRDQMPKRPEGINPRDDFNPWKHGQVPSASSISPQWPYTGRKYHAGFTGPSMQSMGGNGFEEDRTSPRPGAPPLMQGLPPNFPPYGYRFGQSGMSQQQVQGQLQTSPMFSPGPGYTQLPGQLQGLHMSGGPQPANGMPMYYQNGIPQNPQYIPAQHMHFHPNTPQRQGPGPGSGGPMYYQHQVPTPQQTPQTTHHNVLNQPGSGQFQQGMQAQGQGGGTFDGGGQH